MLMCFDCVSIALNEQHKVKVLLAEQYDSPLHEVSKFITLNQTISGLKIQAKTIQKQWAKMPNKNKTRMLIQLQERLQFIVSMQNEEKGSFGEIIPAKYATYDPNQPELFEEILRFVQTD